MFVSNELVQLVFADENDTYYGEDLTELNLDQFLWLRLHKSGYRSVYFLRERSKGDFSVRRFAGDRNSPPFNPERSQFFGWLIHGRENELGEWMQRQLRSHTALVCPLADFCKAASGPAWESVLRGIAEDKKRQGILVLTAPLEAEKSAELLLCSKVFEWLEDTAIQDAQRKPPQDLYGYLRQKKTPDVCVVLNPFTEEGREGITGLLRNLELTRSDSVLTAAERSAAAAYLIDYLASPRMQREDPLFSHSIPGAYLQAKTLWKYLSEEKVWTELRKRSGDHQTRNPVKTPYMRVCGDRDSVMERCINRVYGLNRDLIRDPLVAKEWDEVMDRLMRPDLVRANPELEACMDRLSLHLTTMDRRNAEGCCRILEVMKAFRKELGNPDPEENRVNLYRDLENVTGTYINILNDLQNQEFSIQQLSAQSGHAAEANLAMLQKNRAVMERVRTVTLNSIREYLNLTVEGPASDYGDLMNKLEDLAEKRKQAERDIRLESAEPIREEPASPVSEEPGTDTRGQSRTRDDDPEPEEPSGSSNRRDWYSSSVPNLNLKP